jgi:endonuclease YncB( thermonuclease family)
MPALAMALLSRPAWAEELYGPVVPLAGNLGPVIEGEAFAVDGGTITIRLHPIRLYGIQTLEHDDPCGDGWTGRSEAMRFLSKLIGGQIVSCTVQGQDRNQRSVAVCSVGNTDINEAMVLNGVALADTFTSKAYRRTEQAAQALGAGYHKPGRRCVPAAGQACGPAGAPDDAADLMAAYMPTFQSGDALPKDGVFDLVFQPVADVIYPAKFEPAGEGGYGGIVTIENVPAGRYRIVFSQPARVDAAQRYALLTPKGNASETRCSASYPAIEVDAEGGPLTLQVSGARTPLISIAVIRLSYASPTVRARVQ